MAVNTSKTKFIIFHTKGKQLTLPPNSIVVDSNEIGSPINPNLIKPIDRIYSQNPNKKERSFKGTVSRDFLTLVFFIKQLLLVPLDMSKKDFEFF
jgi:hypothetical protein